MRQTSYLAKGTRIGRPGKTLRNRIRSGSAPIRTLGKGSHQNIRHRAFGDVVQTPCHEIAMPAGMGRQRPGMAPSLARRKYRNGFKDLTVRAENDPAGYDCAFDR